MDELIRELFRGNLGAFDPPFSEHAQQNECFSKMEALTEQMKEAVPAEFHPLLAEYERSMMELLDAACEDDFVHGYRLGIQMLLAAWPQRDM